MNTDSEKPAGMPPEAETPSRILVVDDQPANIQVVGAALGRLGHEIIPASDGPTALRRLALRPPDLILLDLLMPEMDGYEVCRRLRENPDWKDIPVIFLSAADDKDFIVRALESGGVDYITKPFNQAELVTRVHTQLALKYARDRLKQLAEDKDELLGILAHDLKSQLGGMEMSAQLLSEHLERRGILDGRTAQLTENIARTGGHLLAFVKDFLANAAADHGISPQLVPVDVSNAAALAIEKIREAARRKKLEIQSNLKVKEAMAVADVAALAQVLDNLLSNAVKFSPLEKRIHVSVECADAHVDCRIEDEGPGFTEQDRMRMFRRYARLSAQPTNGEPSTGLGLSIVRKLVRAMNGELLCESNPGHGAAFIVRLPRLAPN
jgi:two-component system, sensor histidine kinase and response regulator